MASRLRSVSRLLAVLGLAAVVLVFAEPAEAVTVPETLADRQPVQAGPVEPGFPIDHLGVLWDTPDRADDSADDHAHDEAGPEPNGAVRFRSDGTWGPWIRLIEDGVGGDGQWASGLVAGGDADAYQVRGMPGDARSPRVVAINTTDGPEVETGERRGGAAGALDSSMCRSRAEWGADETLRLDSAGNEIWPPEFYGTQTLTVHHTATDNDDPDPAATVRAIYRYHAVDQGWGDIGYQYLIDEQGVVYEGRWSGTTSTSCGSGGDGSDFGHENTDLDGDGTGDEMVTGAHTGGYNSGNLGVALLGEFTDHPRWGGEPTTAAVGSLEDVLAELSQRHGLDPTGVVTYVNPHPSSDATRTVDTISGHRDWNATECPGERLYAQLPTIRQNVKAAVDGSDGDTDDGTSDPPAEDDPLTATGVTPDTLGVGADQALTVSGTGFTDGATVSLENGKGHTPTVHTTTRVDDTTLEATVTVENKGPSGWWDVRVTLTDGRADTCRSCVYVQR